MESKMNEKITWTLLELGGLLEEEDSRVYFERTKKHLALYPFYLTNLQAALNEILSSMLNTYDSELKGFMLAYKNPKLLSSLGETYCDTCFIHIDIEADFYLFRPEVGCSLKGIVNKKGLDHIVILVHKTFTVSIPKPDDTDEWLGDSVDIGQEVRCCVTQIDKTIKLPFISAILNSDYLQGCRLLINNIDNIDTAIESNNVDSSNEMIDKLTVSEDDLISDRERKKSRKKRKKSREIDSKATIMNENNELINNLESDIAISIKRENKHKSIKCNIDHSLNNTEINPSKKYKKSELTPKVSSDSESETHVRVKVEKPDPDTYNNTESGNQLLFNNSTDANNDTNLNRFEESHRGVKREHSTADTSFEKPERKKKKKKKSRESDRESTTENEEKVIHNIVNVIPDIKHDNEEQCNSKKHSVSNTDLSWSNSEINNTYKKHKKSKKKPLVRSDSEPEDHVKIKVEKPDPLTDRTTGESSKNQITLSENESNRTQNDIEVYRYVKREDSDRCDSSDKEKKKKYAKISKEADSKSTIRIKFENSDTNDISRTIKCDEQDKHTKYNNISNTDVSSSKSDLDHISKKHKKNKKTSKRSISESEHPVKIKVEKI